MQNQKMRVLRINCIFFIYILVFSTSINAQVDEETGSYQVILESIQSLESTKDPKCHATASRLEDFMYGTPLTDEAREYRIDIQKDLVRTVWKKASDINEGETIDPKLINQIVDEIILFFVVDDEWYLRLTDGSNLHISQRDYKHYSSIAYSLRAILSVQQEDLFGDRKFDPIDEDAVQRLKFVVDITSIGLLKIADRIARLDNRYEITKTDFEQSWKLLSSTDLNPEQVIKKTQPSTYDLTMSVIAQKLKSYEEYNQLNQKIFLRNIQVFFAKVPWPKDSLSANHLTRAFQNHMVSFASKLFLDAQSLALNEDESFIRHRNVRKALQKLLPHTINEFEDVTFFNRLSKDQQITIEAYDLDAFRDSGIHWNYLEAAIRQSVDELQIEADPHAMELLVEGIAQMGVLLWRVSGSIATINEQSQLNHTHLEEAYTAVIDLSNQHNATSIDELKPEDQTSIRSSLSNTEGSFIDVTFNTGIDFKHKTSDWLSRQIRSYIVKEEENVARLAIPPAFGGGGVAAEDINQDGFADILLLGGQGVHLYLNNGDKTFKNITEESGLKWSRVDGTFGEPRQPIIADFDNDGIYDIFISYANDRHRMYKGLGNGQFQDFTINAQLEGQGLIGGPCTALDYDKDGLLDIYIGYFGNYLEGNLPTLKRHNDNGSPNKLFKNLGGFRFKDVTEGSGVDNTGWTQAVGHADIDNDGWQDLIVGNDFGVNAYYINNGDGTFTDKSEELGVNKPSYTMNIGFTDLNADDLPDFYISNIVVMEKDDKYTAPTANTTMHFRPEVLANMRVVEANDLFVSQKKSNSYEQSRSIGRGYSSTGWAWDADFFDYDNDGDDDLYCLNGMNQYSVYGTQNPYYASPDGEELDVVFAASQSAKNVFFENVEGFLENRSENSGLDLNHTSRSAAYLDYDNDGDLDIIINNYNGSAFFYENKTEKIGNNWLAIDLKNTDTDSGSLIGTKVRVKAGKNINTWRQLSSTTGYLSVHPNRIHVGLGKEKECTVEVTWPDNKKQKVKVNEVNKVVVIKKE